MQEEERFFDRELSWLSFNGRVLQEAKDPSVPLYERIKFLAIYSSNLDEFFRVRVASLRGLKALKKKKQKKLGIDAKEVLSEIHAMVEEQQNAFGKIYRREILPLLGACGIHLIEKPISSEQEKFVATYFQENVRPLLAPVFLHRHEPAPFLQNKALYFAIALLTREKQPLEHHALVEIPSGELPRFVMLPSEGREVAIMFLDDIIRESLPELFPEYEVAYAHSIKLTRDAELYIDDEFSGDLIEKIKKGLGKRKTGAPCRFLFDSDMPRNMLHLLMEILLLDEEDIVPGGRYHNYNDFFSFPNPGYETLAYLPQPPLAHPELNLARSFFEQISEKDVLLHFPYQTYDIVLKLLAEATLDQNVEEIFITLYRVNSTSEVVAELLRALENGKKVTVFVEVKARFDEETNFYWADALKCAGARVLFSMPGWKVHAKVCLITRREEGNVQRYAYLATGNFNEKTARIYTDHALLTKHDGITADAAKTFDALLKGELYPDKDDFHFEHLLVAPYNLRSRFLSLIQNEIENAKLGKPAYMILKMNSLEDSEMIEALYAASQAGVKIRLIVRGIFRLIPGIEGFSDNIEAQSIIDRFLEHGRIYIFANGGDEKIFAASADWMTRNLSRRVEVAFPIYDERLKMEIRDIVNLQLADNQKTRILDAEQQNKYRKPKGDEPKVRAQTDIYRYLKEKLED
ncbi:Polyphosphate kinase [Chloroherpeton thalassium ATCC 35110]|uniref:Polyphosphate kinase n=1 Tax=Chloroherpeton thalassium (strain ATCC 35110 / GB-78) TaxID=517418 RepID=B3QTW8_CHLT3|nr:polyphosphate kinase 1 [Chloroherpeton thalassium]ACF14316.1 Polyphosphate kinase [Chloroherpeton thalassium ATCC 35110]